MKKRIQLALLALFMVFIYIFKAELFDSVVTLVFYNREGRYLTPDATLQIRSSDHEYFRFYEIKDSRFGHKWIPFCHSRNSPDKLMQIVVNGHSAIVSASRTNAILYYCVSRDEAYPFSIFGVPGVSRPVLPPGFVYEYDFRSPSGVATLSGGASVPTVYDPLSKLVRDLYADRYQLDTHSEIRGQPESAD